MRFDVVIAAHTVVGPNRSYPIPETRTIVGETSAGRARLLALTWAHCDAGVPPWRPYRLQSWPHTRATLHVATKAERMKAARAARA